LAYNEFRLFIAILVSRNGFSDFIKGCLAFLIKALKELLSYRLAHFF
jgi:hypothetical protein